MNNNFITLPLNDKELNKQIEFQKRLLKDIVGISITEDNFDKFRDWYCQSFLGMKTNGYKQLQEFWENRKKALAPALQRLVDSNASEIWCWFNDVDDFEFNFSKDYVFDNTKGIVNFDSDEFNGVSEKLATAIIENYFAEKVLIEYPSGEKFGIPTIANKFITEQCLSHWYGITALNIGELHSNVFTYDRARDHEDDGMMTILVKLVKK